jgi:hypothetical protein
MMQAADVLARAPLRVSLAGGGTDLPSYANSHGGMVISVATLPSTVSLGLRFTPEASLTMSE